MLDCPTGLAATVFVALKGGGTVYLARPQVAGHPRSGAELMEPGAESRSRRPRRENGRGKPPTPTEQPSEPGFVDTSEIQFELSSHGDEAVVEPERPTEPVAGEGDEAANQTATKPDRDARAARVDREIPAPPQPTAPADGNGGGNGKPPDVVIPAPGPPSLPQRRDRPRLKKLRMLFVLAGLSVLALVSAVFGMMAAVSTDLPAIYNFAQFRAAKNTVVLDDTNAPIGTLSSNQNKILLESGQISQNIKNATVSIEDSRFYQHSGVDYQGIARALVQDVLSRSAKQGASTITQQFVKNALEAQGSRTILEKFREAALAYRLEQHWSKDKILTEYLNTIYYGEGAYGIEAAARTYFGAAHPSCGTSVEPCAQVLLPQEAAMLAGVIASPSAYDPKLHPVAAKERRDEVLQKMLEQGYITEQQYTQGVQAALPSESQIQPPQLDSKAPYFTSWLRQQLVDKYGAGKAFFGGLKVHSTLDLGLQSAAEAAVYNRTAALGITSSVVVLDNKTGGVKAMVGGPGYDTQPFNIAAYGTRQPGSSFKPFTLVSALELGHSPYEVFSSQPKVFHFGKHGKQLFPVHNYGDNYLGSASLITATQYSDNSVYADLGLHLKKTPKESTKYIARTARRMGIISPVSVNPAMVLGGLRVGVEPLEMAHAYETLAEGGLRISGTLAPNPGIDPIAYTRVSTGDGHTVDENNSIKTRVMPTSVANTAKQLLANVISGGTGQNAAGVSSYEWGKTGTTENNGDAWFCGATRDSTTCVWVGHADSVTPMLTEYGGAPVDGGTIPALIWHDVMGAWEQIRAEHAAAKKNGGKSTSTYVPPTSSGTSTYSAPAPSSGSTSSGGSAGGGGGGGRAGNAAPAPQHAAPAPTPTPSGGGGATAGGGVAPG
jgi:penicillin-binding protein 1A